MCSEPTAFRGPPSRLSRGDNERDGEGAEICIGTVKLLTVPAHVYSTTSTCSTSSNHSTLHHMSESQCRRSNP